MEKQFFENPDAFKTLLIDIYRRLAIFYDENNDVKKAKEYFENGAKILELVNIDENYELFSSFYHDIGTFYDRYKRGSEKSIEYLKKSALLNEERYKKIPSKYEEVLAKDYYNIGITYLHQEKFKNAESFFIKGIYLLENSKNDSIFLADMYNRMATVYHTQKNYDDAIIWYLKSINEYDKNELSDAELEESSYNYYSISDCYEVTNNIEDAIKYANKELDILIQLKKNTKRTKEYLEKMYNILIDRYEKDDNKIRKLEILTNYYYFLTKIDNKNKKEDIYQKIYKLAISIKKFDEIEKICIERINEFEKEKNDIEYGGNELRILYNNAMVLEGKQFNFKKSFYYAKKIVEMGAKK